jgi:hypothetical protein
MRQPLSSSKKPRQPAKMPLMPCRSIKTTATIIAGGREFKSPRSDQSTQ